MTVNGQKLLLSLVFTILWWTCYMPGCSLSAPTSGSFAWFPPAVLGTQDCASVSPSHLSAPSVQGYCSKVKVHPGRGTRSLYRRALHGARVSEVHLHSTFKKEVTL